MSLDAMLTRAALETLPSRVSHWEGFCPLEFLQQIVVPRIPSERFLVVRDTHAEEPIGVPGALETPSRLTELPLSVARKNATAAAIQRPTDRTQTRRERSSV